MQDMLGEFSVEDWLTGEAARVSIRTLGPFRLRIDGRAIGGIPRTRSKPLDLLRALIALGGEAVSEQRLTDALWAESDGDRAHGAFKTTLHRLRKLVGGEAVVVADGGVSLDTTVCWWDTRAYLIHLSAVSGDVAAGEPLAALGALQAALALYRGPFLEGTFDPPEILPTREKLHRMFLRHVAEVGALLDDCELWNESLRLYRAALEIDPGAEDIAQALMRCRLATRHYSEALAVYDSLHRTLHGQYGVEPSEATRNLRDRLLATARAHVNSTRTRPAPAAFRPAPATLAPRRNLNYCQLLRFELARRRASIQPKPSPSSD